MTILSLVAGLLTNFRFQFVGKGSAGEFLLAVVAVFAVLANVGNSRFWNRRYLMVLTVLCISFAGYIISDLVNATPPDRLARGWARMGFVIMDFIAIWSLARNSVMNLFAICVGDALSTLISYGNEHPDFLYNYKFHLAMPITVFIIVLMPVVMRKNANLATGVALVGLGMCHLWLDFRMMGGICILIGFVMIARCLTALRLRSLYLSLLALSLILSSMAIAFFYTATNESFAGRREGSNIVRSGLALAGVNAIRRSPIIGLGSWAWDNEMWNVFAGKMGRGNISEWNEGEAQGPHSQIIQAWAEAGVLGVIFFVYFGKLMTQGLYVLVLRRPLDLLTPLFLYHLLLGLWNLLFSPFANLHRFAIGLVLVISIQIVRENVPVRVCRNRVPWPPTFGRSGEARRPVPFPLSVSVRP